MKAPDKRYYCSAKSCEIALDRLDSAPSRAASKSSFTSNAAALRALTYCFIYRSRRNARQTHSQPRAFTNWPSVRNTVI